FIEHSTGEKGLSTLEYTAIGRKLLTEKDEVVNSLEIKVEGFENSKRPVKIIKIQKAYNLFKSLIRFYGISHLITHAVNENEFSVTNLTKKLAGKNLERKTWINVGGQLLPQETVVGLRKMIYNGKIKSWDDVHAFYKKEGEK